MKELKWKDFKIKDEQTNLIENSWDSFDIVGDTENLIPNGWDSFEPYGGAEIKITPLGNGLYRLQTFGGNSPIKLRCFLNNKLVIDNHYTDSLYIYERSTPIIKLFNDSMYLEKGFHKNETNSKTTTIDYQFRAESKDGNLDFIASDPIINIGDKPNLTLLKEKLDNGLTHIRAYGGQENSKLRFIANSEKVGEPLNLSMYIENKGSDITLHHDAPSTNDAIETGYQGFFETQTEVSVGNYKYVGLGTKGHLDFIASDPQLVESTKHNPVLIVDELEDGREHVQVHGAYVDTKLISKEVQGFSGEPYQIKTNIDNEGLELSMSSTLGDKSIDINKGSNSISHTGELKGNRIVVELGAKNG